MLVLDESLISEVEALGNGESIHSKNEAICNYKMAFSLAAGSAWWIQDKSEEKKQKIMDSGAKLFYQRERYLVSMVTTNGYPSIAKPRVLI